MFEKIKNGVKTKSFWAGLLTGIAGLLTGTITAPELIINLINLIGG